MYVTEGPLDHHLAILDTDTNQVVNSIVVGPGFRSAQIDGSEVVVDYEDGRRVAFDIETGIVVREVGPARA